MLSPGSAGTPWFRHTRPDVRKRTGAGNPRLILRVTLCGRRRRVVLLDVFEGEVARQRDTAEPGVAGNKLDAKTADRLPVLPLKLAFAQADTDDRVRQTLVETHDLSLRTPTLRGQPKFRNTQNLRVERRIEHEPAQRAGVQLAQRRKTNAPAEAAIQQ